MSYFSASIYTNKNGFYSEVIPSASRPTELEAIEHAIISYEGKRISIEQVSDVIDLSPSGRDYVKDVEYSLAYKYGEVPEFKKVRVYLHDFSGQLTLEPDYLQIVRDTIKSLL
jgi:hypothetical protein